MLSFFSKSQKNPNEIVRSLKDGLVSLERADRKPEKVLWVSTSAKLKRLLRNTVCSLFIFQVSEEVSKLLQSTKGMLLGAPEQEPQTEILAAQLAQEMYNQNLLLIILQNMKRVDFEVCVAEYCFLVLPLNEWENWDSSRLFFQRVRKMLLKYSTSFYDGKLERGRPQSSTSVPNPKFSSCLFQGKRKFYIPCRLV